MSDLPPDWAIEKAVPASQEAIFYGDRWPVTQIKNAYANKTPYAVTVMKFARYIAEHEEAPVDPLVLEARKIVQDRNLHTPCRFIDGRADNHQEMIVAINALRRGMEIERNKI